MSIILSSAFMAGKNYNLQSARRPANYTDRVIVNARHIVRTRGVSALLSLWKQELDKRPEEDRSTCWRPLLRTAHAVVWERYARDGETLEVGCDFAEVEPGVWLPYVWAHATSGPKRSAKWFADPERNVFINWH
ncbi:hypothetical protein KIH86_03525 [Paenibacillus sp. HN-1]|uniref:hypothetical protein n=1 Tax=Paenibacillus TaxID=44249 RepID=UPI001CA9C061|nr:MULTISPECIES: hypothetical protein [Paenibacillus]MBY9077252.1 hypothetical protein [Paenibacillus sp. CGMCC 1.18879]MBY9083299.1 hypothetical protein [Paenibacillus sinensis]